MNTASLELCKELYELSGWEGTSFFHDTSEGVDEWRLEYSSSKTLPVDGGLYPAYDLGYLLRKLPQELTTHHMFDLTHFPTHWSAAYLKGLDSTDIKFVTTANTPEDAVAKLCIELYKQGILK